MHASGLQIPQSAQRTDETLSKQAIPLLGTS